MKWNLRMVQLRGTMPTAQIDGEGYTKALLEEIIDHKADSTAIPVSQGTTSSGKPKTTTRCDKNQPMVVLESFRSN